MGERLREEIRLREERLREAEERLREAAQHGRIDERLREEIRLREERLRKAEERLREERLREAAQHGSIDVFYTLIGKDTNLLDRIDQVPFIDTPLHIAAYVGQTQFAMEMVNLKPSFSRKLNQDGFSPMHLALQNGHHQMVLRLLDVDRDLVRVKGREGVTPLHFAAKEGLQNILAEFLIACPKSIQDLTIRKETALHIAVKNDRVEALEVLLGWLWKVNHREILNWEDDDVNTTLDIVINKIQGLTELDVEDQRVQSEKIRKMLCHAGAARARARARALSRTPVNTLEEFIKTPWCSLSPQIIIKTILEFNTENRFKTISQFFTTFRIEMFRRGKNVKNEDRSAMLVCAVLIATSTFQSVVKPLGGVLQNNNSPATATITNATAATTTQGNGSLPHYRVGTSKLWFPFWFINSIAFLYSVMYIYIYLGPVRDNMTLFNLLPLTICYVLALLIVAPNSLPIIYVLIYVSVGFVMAITVLKFCGRNGDYSRHCNSLFKRWPSFHKQMAELENSE